MTFLRGAAEGGRDIIFKECTPDVIMQVNMIPSFAGNAKIESFYCNYICETCDNTETVLLEVEKLPKNELPTSYGCECGAEMVTEELEDEYFAFLMEG